MDFQRANAKSFDTTEPAVIISTGKTCKELKNSNIQKPQLCRAETHLQNKMELSHEIFQNLKVSLSHHKSYRKKSWQPPCRKATFTHGYIAVTLLFSLNCYNSASQLCRAAVSSSIPLNLTGLQTLIILSLLFGNFTLALRLMTCQFRSLTGLRSTLLTANLISYLVICPMETNRKKNPQKVSVQIFSGFLTQSKNMIYRLIDYSKLRLVTCADLEYPILTQQ